MDFKKYKNCYVKLLNINNMTEIYGKLVDFDTKGNICLSRSILSINRFNVDPASVLNKIIKYTYSEEGGSTISSILGPMYNNCKNDSIVWLNVNNYTFIPLYDNLHDMSDEATETKKRIIAWIDYVYNNYEEMYNLLTNEQSANENLEEDTK
jgi:hypothetical protein